MWLLLISFWTGNALSFGSTWAVASENLTLPFTSTSGAISVNWGDGSVQNFTAGNKVVTHHYSLNGIVTVGVSGTVTGFNFNGNGDRLKLLGISRWGEFVVDATSSGAFWGCSNLIINASDQPVIAVGATLENFFRECTLLDSPLSAWNTANVTNMAGMFYGAAGFNQALAFNTSSVVNMSRMFYQASNFNQVLNFNVRNVVDMSGMFASARNFNCSFKFDTTNVVNMDSMFLDASSFNQAVNFSTGKVNSMRAMFSGARSFNQTVLFNTSRVTTMASMFENAAAFNNIPDFDTQLVTAMQQMFQGAVSFNQPLYFITARVTNMTRMFAGAINFNQLLYFNVAGVTDMRSMFENASSFSQNLAQWMVQSTSNCSLFCSQCGLPNFVCKPCLGPTLISARSWRVCSCPEGELVTADSSQCGRAFISVWATRAANETITLPLRNSNYSILISWGDGVISNFSQNLGIHMYALPGNYTVAVVGRLTGFRFNRGGDCNKILNVAYWGDFVVDQTSLGVFRGCSNLTVTASGQPLFVTGATMNYMFGDCTSFNNSLLWDTSNVTSMEGVFFSATNFNQPVTFITTAVTTMASMFFGATSFNQAVTFGVGNVIDFTGMFQHATRFNQPIHFNTRSATDMGWMFNNANDFNQPLTLNTTTVRSMQFMFLNATNFNSSITFTSTKSVTNIRGMFQSALSFNQPLDFDTRNVQIFNDFLHGAQSFNQTLNLETSNATSMTSMFQEALAFNQPLSSFNTRNVKNMDRMFYQARDFNQPLDFNTANVTSMNEMFFQADRFNQLLNFSTGKVVSMDNMFLEANMFEQNLDLWNVTQVENCSSFCLRCGLPILFNCSACEGPILKSTHGWGVCSCAIGEGISGSECVTFAPTLVPTPPTTPTSVPTVPTAPTVPTTTKAPTPPPPTYPTASAPYDPNGTTTLLISHVTAIIRPDSQFNETGDFSLTVLPKLDATNSPVVRVQFFGFDGIMLVENLTAPIVLRFPMYVKPQYLDGVVVCLSGAVATEAIVPECGWFDAHNGEWATEGCKRTNYSLIEIQCTCDRLGDFAAILPVFDMVPLSDGKGVTTESVSANSWGTLCVVIVYVVFLVIFALALLRDGISSGHDRDNLHFKWERTMGRPVWRQLKLACQRRHTWTALTCRKSVTTFKSVDRIFVALVAVYSCMTISAYLHTMEESWISHSWEIVFTSLVSLAPSQLFTMLFARSGPLGFFEQWEYEVGLLRRYCTTRCRLPACFLWVWRTLAGVGSFVMSAYIIFISLSFDQNSRYYCAGNTVMLWVADWVSSYFLLVLVFEPTYIALLTLLRICFEKYTRAGPRQTRISQVSVRGSV